MDEQYMTKMATSFLEELTEIEKQAGIGSFLMSGARRVGKGLMNIGKPGGVMGAIGGAGAQRAGGVMPHMKQIWGAGAAKAAKGGGSEFMGGLGALARSRYGQVGGALAVPLAAGYGVHKMTEG